MFFQKRSRQTAAACVLLALVTNPLAVQASLPETPHLRPVFKQASACQIVMLRFKRLRHVLALAGQTPRDVFLLNASSTPYELYWRLGFNVAPSAWLVPQPRGIPFVVTSLQSLVMLKRFLRPQEEREILNLASLDSAFGCFPDARLTTAAP